MSSGFAHRKRSSRIWITKDGGRHWHPFHMLYGTVEETVVWLLMQSYLVRVWPEEVTSADQNGYTTFKPKKSFIPSAYEIKERL